MATSDMVKGSGQTPSVSHPKGVLCQRCTNLDLLSAFEPVQGLQPDVDHCYIQRLAHIGSTTSFQADANCPLCRLLGEVLYHPARVAKTSPNFVTEQYIHVMDALAQFDLEQDAACKACRVVGILWFEHDRPFYLHWFDGTVQASGLIVRLDRHLGPAIHDVPHEVSYELLMSWLLSAHERLAMCMRSDPPAMSHLVDCQRMTVVPARYDQEYAALSYVWGGRRHNVLVDDTGQLVKDLPLTISDAIQVTLGIGLHYLWVDQLCIPQADPEEFRRQIVKMDAIYRGAEVVLVAAAGDDPTYGLPGVSLRRRSAILRERIGENDYVVLKHPQSFVEASVWSRRAWTDQESVCARRKLYFTDDQVVFVCPNTYEQERPTNMHSNYYILSTPNIPSDFTPFNVTDHISAYSDRQLSHDGDALNAILGVFRMFAESKQPVHHIYGVPIMPL